MQFLTLSVSLQDKDGRCKDVLNTASLDGFKFQVGLAYVSHFSSQARGQDGIPQSVVAKALPIIEEHLVELFDFSFARDVFPDLWKKARVRPMKKCATPKSPSDFGLNFDLNFDFTLSFKCARKDSTRPDARVLEKRENP